MPDGVTGAEAIYAEVRRLSGDLAAPAPPRFTDAAPGMCCTMMVGRPSVPRRTIALRSVVSMVSSRPLTRS